MEALIAKYRPQLLKNVAAFSRGADEAGEFYMYNSNRYTVAASM